MVIFVVRLLWNSRVADCSVKQREGNLQIFLSGRQLPASPLVSWASPVETTHRGPERHIPALSVVWDDLQLLVVWDVRPGS